MEGIETPDSANIALTLTLYTTGQPQRPIHSIHLVTARKLCLTPYVKSFELSTAPHRVQRQLPSSSMHGAP